MNISSSKSVYDSNETVNGERADSFVTCVVLVSLFSRRPMAADLKRFYRSDHLISLQLHVNI